MTTTITLPRDRERSLVLVASFGGKVSRYPLVLGESVAIGRSRDVEIVIDHESISRQHCTLRIGEALELVDGGSRNGTFVLGRRIEPNHPVEIAVGTAFDIGAATLMVHYDGPAPARPKETAFRDSAMRALDDLIELIAPTSLPVLVFGETGTGKEMIAELVHRRSDRAAKPLVRINCAAMTESLLESELFGYEKGAFTGAASPRGGLFEAADQGTLFFDELGEMPASMQAKLLRVLESGEVLRVGSVQPRKVDVRFIAATHRDLQAMVAAGTFRRDLFYRLNGFAIGLPPLRDRPDDILAIAGQLLERIGERSGTIPRLSSQASDRLRHHPWPGNVRELKTTLERAAVLAAGGPIEAAHLLLEMPTSAPPAPGARLTPDAIARALASTAGNQKEAAKLLGVSRPTLIKYIELYGLARPRKG